MGRKLMAGAVLPVFLAVLFFSGIALADSTCATLPEDFSWYGESGATREPVYDVEKDGLWWIPESVPAGQENTQWGNRGYIFVGAPKKEEVVEKPAPVKKTAVAAKSEAKPEVKIVEKIVGRTKYVFLNLKDVYFGFDSAKITSLNKQVLQDNASILQQYPSVKVSLVGSASPEGDSTYNQKLSERRVNAVKDYLVNKEGIAVNRLKMNADGEVQVADKSAWPLVRKVSFIAVE